MNNTDNVQKYLLLPLSKLIINSIAKFQLFKLVVTLIFLSGFTFCFYLLDYHRCGLLPRNVIRAGLVFYLMDLAQHLITFNFGEEIVHKIFSKHHPYKLETWYTLKITFTIVEIIYFVLAAINHSQFTICVETKVFMTSFLATYASLHGFIIVVALCFGECMYESFQKLKGLAKTVFHKAIEGGIDYVESIVEDNLEPLSMIWNGRIRITERNKLKIWEEDIERQYELLEMAKGSLKNSLTSKLLTTATSRLVTSSTLN